MKQSSGVLVKVKGTGKIKLRHPRCVDKNCEDELDLTKRAIGSGDGLVALSPNINHTCVCGEPVTWD